MKALIGERRSSLETFTVDMKTGHGEGLVTTQHGMSPKELAERVKTIQRGLEGEESE